VKEAHSKNKICLAISLHLPSKGHLTKKLFIAVSVLLHENEYIPGVLM
jgi:hypothetical protein